MGASTSNCRVLLLRLGFAVAAAAAAAVPGSATPVVGVATIDYYKEAVGVGAGILFDGVGAGQLLSAGVGHPSVTLLGVPVQTAVDGNTFDGFVSAAPPALGAAAVSSVTAVNFGSTAYTLVSLFPTAMGPDAAPGTATVVTNNSLTVVSNTSGVNNPGYAYTAIAARIGIRPAAPSASYVAIALSADMSIDNPGVANDFAIPMPDIVFATDGTLGALDTAVAGTFAIVQPQGIIGGVEIYDVFGLSLVTNVGGVPLNVENGGTLSVSLTFTGLVDPADFQIIEFPPDLLQSLLPDGPGLVSAAVAQVPEPADLAIFGTALVLLVVARRRRVAVWASRDRPRA